MDGNYELTYNENQEEDEELVFENRRRQIANTLLQYLSSPNYEPEEKIDILLELLYRKNYDREDFQNYSLATLKNSINIEFEETESVKRTQGCENMFAIFREDNSFIIAKEEYYQTNKRNKYMYSLYDAITNSLLYRYLYNQKEEPITNLPWRNGSIIKINGIKSYVVPISLVIPAKYFVNTGIEIIKLRAISDCINQYLSENPLFVEKVFIKTKKRELRQEL